MASYGRFPAAPQPYTSSTSPLPPVPAYPAAQPPTQPAPAQVRPGTLPPGTIVNVGQYTVTVNRYLSEGGFAHVYLANSSVPLPVGSPTATTKHVLKRMVVPDKRGVEEVGKEVDVMRQLKNHPKIVNMIEASVADLPGGVDGSKGYEIYILMEWCPGGGIIDMMNTRLQNRLTESEILKIFSDVVEAVAHMHYQNPPLIHRDLKVENILLTPPQTYKLCDFGSTTKPLPREKVPTSVEGLQKVELEINKTTTLQYRAPELVDVWGRKGFDEKIDIWALGVFLYKLCFYTTPFEEHGPLAILNAQYKFPPYPAYSSNIRSLIASMLQERASQRPNIYQVHEMVCRLRGAPIRLENKYANLAPSATGTSSLSPSTSPLPPRQPPTNNILSAVAPPPPPSGATLTADSIAPMRRGRPGKSPASGPAPASETRQVRTGLATVGSQSEKPLPGAGGGGEGWEFFASSTSAKSPTAVTSGFDSAPPASRAQTGAVEGFGGGGDGFGDAFTPSKELQTSIELPANAAMFADLVPPTPSKEGDAGRKSPMDLFRAQQRAAGKKETGEKGNEEDERKRFEAAFPDLDSGGDAFPSLSSSSVPPATITTSEPSFSLLDASPPLPPVPSTASGMPSQLTGDESTSVAAPGPPLPRRPPSSTTSASGPPARLPTPGAPSPVPSPSLPPSSSSSAPEQQTTRQGFKPELVSRGSQTSPHLLASWREKEEAAKKEKEKEGEGKHALRQSSVPELDLSSPGESPVLPSAAQEKGKKVLDLLGDDEDVSGGGGYRAPLPTSPSSAPTSSLAGNVASKRQSFAALPSSSPSSNTTGSSVPGGGEREKFRPSKRTSWLPSSATSSSSAPASPAFGSQQANKPGFAPKPSLGGLGRKADGEEDPEDKSVEERFPALNLEDGTNGNSEGRKEEQWEKLVEKEEVEEDSSDDEAAPAQPPKQEQIQETGKPAAPAFDDDDFAPRPIVQLKPSSFNSRPRFGSSASGSISGGGGFKPSSSVLSDAPNPPLSTSPAPLAPSPLPSTVSISPAPPSDSRGFSTSSSSSAGGGGIDLGPALASIRKFAPSSNPAGERGVPPAVPPKQHLLDAGEDEDDFPPTSPGVRAGQPTSPSTGTSAASRPLPPLAAPKPTPAPAKAGINSLVSRFDHLPSGPLTGGPPPLGSKPVGLRKDSSNSSTSAHGYLRDEVKPRALPQWNAPPPSSSPAPAPVPPSPSFSPAPPPKPSTPSFPPAPSPGPAATSSSPLTTRAPFKPVPPPGSPSAARAAAGQAREPHGSTVSRASEYGVAPRAPPALQDGQTQEEEEDRFKGVSSMKSRWESMAKQGDGGASGGAGRNGAPGRGVRKEWAAV
ncbi:hypothetical protein JCM8547_007829 [Rhodosporidiobolus lusitaniae]